MPTYEYARTIPAETDYDILVCGGGPAGFAAAIAAGRLGKKVLLAEATGCLGGMATNGMVTAFDGMGDGEKCLVGGIMREIVETLHQRGGLAAGTHPDFWRKSMYCPTRFHPEALKILLDDLTAEAGVEVRFFTRFVDVDADSDVGLVNGAILHQEEGLRYVPAGMFIDATGSGALSHLAGAQTLRAGRDTPDIMPASLCWFACNQEHHPGAREAVDRAVAEGRFPRNEYRAIPSRLGDGQTTYNAGHLYQLDSLDTAALSAGMAQGRKLAGLYNDFLREHAPGNEKMHIAATAPLMGVRESRRIVGEYTITAADFRDRRTFPDQIGVYNKEVDIHCYSDDIDTLKKHRKLRADRSNRDYWMMPGEHYGIAYGSMVPRGWKNLWAPGRSVSADVIMHGSARVMPSCVMQGQAAGTAAVQCIDSAQHACDLDTAALVTTLRENGAYLPQKELRGEMTRQQVEEMARKAGKS
jgi:hypothetical protein